MSEAMRTHALEAEGFLKELANAKRLLILCQLVEGEKSAGDLAKIAELSHSAMSQHLTRLRQAGLVKSEKRGQMVMYRLASMQVQALLSLLHVMFCKTR